MTIRKKTKPTTSKRTATAKPKRSSKSRKQATAKASKPKPPPDDGPTGAAPAVPAKPVTVPEQPDDSQTLVVFAFRLSRPERDLIHAAAGSGKASSFVRGVALAAARRDAAAIQSVIGEAEARLAQ